MKILSAVFISILTIAVSLAQEFQLAQTENAVVVRDAGGHVTLEYQKVKPVDSALVVNSGGFFHPLRTPEGVVVTDLAPEDHPHHRGVFLAFVEMHGSKDADFWGWGEHAPTRGRRIVNRAIEDAKAHRDGAAFTARNHWVAEETVLVDERLEAVLRDRDRLRILDLTYTLTPRSDITLSRWAFSGFCLRVRKDAETLGVFSPDGKIDLPNPSHVEPDSDWPDAPWYAFSQMLTDGRVFGAAVLSHPDNPPTLWHNHRDVRMLNPCIVAPAERKLENGKPLTLRYRVVTFDGNVPARRLDDLQW